MSERCLEGKMLKEMADKEAELMKMSRRKGRQTKRRKTGKKAKEEEYPVNPGSPVTTESGLSTSEDCLDLDLISCDVLPPLIGGEVELGLAPDDLGAIFNGDEMFGYQEGLVSSGCGTLGGLDTRFGPFELDNLQSFELSKVEGL